MHLSPNNNSIVLVTDGGCVSILCDPIDFIYALLPISVISKEGTVVFIIGYCHPPIEASLQRLIRQFYQAASITPPLKLYLSLTPPKKTPKTNLRTVSSFYTIKITYLLQQISSIFYKCVPLKYIHLYYL